jgi:hypothetical protein
MLFFVNFLGNGSWSGSDNDCQYFATILGIDGGGVRGIIPSIVLTALEAKLQALTFSGQLFQSFNNGVGPHVNLVSNYFLILLLYLVI